MIQNGEIVDVERYKHSLTHFKERLLDRYGISITDSEYFELCREEKRLIYIISPVKRFMSMVIKSKTVNVIYSNESCLLLTCVNDKRLPMPTYFKKFMEYSEFLDFYRIHFNIIMGCEKWLHENKDTPDFKAIFFRDFKYPKASFYHKSLALYSFYGEDRYRIWTNEFMKFLVREHKYANKIYN